jgi:hypothetical protein
MRFFVIDDPDQSVAVVFHDHRDHSVYCRSNRASFLNSFDAMLAKKGISFHKELARSVVLRAVYKSVSGDSALLSELLAELCSGYWKVVHEGTVNSMESGVDAIADKYLC